MKATRALHGDSAYAEAVRDHVARAAGLGPVVPLDSVRVPEEVTVGYRYLLGPVLLVALDRYAGEDVVRRALRGFMENPPAGEVDYAAFRERLREAGASAGALGRFEEECLHRPVQTGCLSGLPGADEPLR